MFNAPSFWKHHTRHFTEWCKSGWCKFKHCLFFLPRKSALSLPLYFRNSIFEIPNFTKLENFCIKKLSVGHICVETATTLEWIILSIIDKKMANNAQNCKNWQLELGRQARLQPFSIPILGDATGDRISTIKKLSTSNSFWREVKKEIIKKFWQGEM